jgi:DNA helicase MCM8
LTEEAARVLQEFYLSLRESHRVDSAPITTRQLESLIRLSEARAKIELREFITERDAQDVVEIMKQSMFQCKEDQLSCVDFRSSSGMSNAKEARRFVAALQRESRLQCKETFTFQELIKLAQDIQISSNSVPQMIESLNLQGYLLKRGPRVYALSI